MISFGKMTVGFALVGAGLAQTPAFEVASVKRAEPITPAMVRAGRLQMGVTIDALHVRINKLSLFELIALAYQVKGYQISCPDWMMTERYDIQATLPEGGRRGQVPAMMQTLLAERLGLKLHREKREISVLGLVAVAGGPRLKPSTAEEAAAGGQLRGGITVGAEGSQVVSGAGGDSKITPGQNGNLHIESKRMTMARLAEAVGRYSELPVVDMTGIEGAYEVELDVSGEEVRAAGRAHGYNVAPETATDPAGVSVVSSLRELGLKLESRKTAAEVLVVDKAEKAPTEN